MIFFNPLWHFPYVIMKFRLICTNNYTKHTNYDLLLFLCTNVVTEYLSCKHYICFEISKSWIFNAVLLWTLGIIYDYVKNIQMMNMKMNAILNSHHLPILTSSHYREIPCILLMHKMLMLTFHKMHYFKSRNSSHVIVYV